MAVAALHGRRRSHRPPPCSGLHELASPMEGHSGGCKYAFDFQCKICLAKGPEIWGPLADNGSPEVPMQSEDQDNILMKPLPNKVNRIFLLFDTALLSSVTLNTF